MPDLLYVCKLNIGIYANANGSEFAPTPGNRSPLCLILNRSRLVRRSSIPSASLARLNGLLLPLSSFILLAMREFWLLARSFPMTDLTW
jgi:hypothetical protein